MKLKIPYLVAAIVASSSLFYIADTPGLSAAQLVSLETLSKQRVDLAAPQGKTRLISFWAPDCPISARDMPGLSQLQKQFKDKEFEVVAVAMPYASEEKILSKMKDTIDYPVAHDRDGSIAAGFPGVRFTPTTFLIDGNGEIVWRRIGKLNATDTAALIAETMQPQQLAKNTVN